MMVNAGHFSISLFKQGSTVQGLQQFCLCARHIDYEVKAYPSEKQSCLLQNEGYVDEYPIHPQERQQSAYPLQCFL